MDESIFPVAPYITYGWFIKGSRPNIRYQHKRREKHCVLGALTSDGFIYEFAEILNSDVFEQFIYRLLEMFKKVIIVIDHSPYHVSGQMQTFYDGHNDCLHVEYFPSYSPELNPIEGIWRETKKWLAIRLWKNKDTLKEQLILAFQEDFATVPIYDYLLP